jgi:hypothetical protein
MKQLSFFWWGEGGRRGGYAAAYFDRWGYKLHGVTSNKRDYFHLEILHYIYFRFKKDGLPSSPFTL